MQIEERTPHGKEDINDSTEDWSHVLRTRKTIIPAQDVVVFYAGTIQVQHAMLILSTSFTKPPVLDNEDHAGGSFNYADHYKACYDQYRL